MTIVKILATCEVEAYHVMLVIIEQRFKFRAYSTYVARMAIVGHALAAS